MVRTSFAHKPKLKTYIESRGQRLPAFYSRHTRHGDRDQYCLFCNAVLDGESHEVQLWKSDIEGAEMTGCYMCDMCAIPVLEMEGKLMGKRGMGHIFDTAGTGARLDVFATTAGFDTDVVKYFQHLDRIFEVRPEESYCCYFCKNSTLINKTQAGSGTNYFLLKVPMSGADYIDGGEVRCCFTCRDLLLELLVEKNISVFYSNKKITEVDCPECGKEYLVGAGEWEYRIDSGQQLNHMCPACTFDTLATSYDGKLDEIYSVKADGFMVTRFIEKFCEYCDAPIELDVTLPPRLTHMLHVSWSDKIMCEDCGAGTHGPIYGYTYNGKVYGVYSTPTEGRYRIIVREISGRQLLSKHIIGDLAQIILNSYFTLERYFEPEQLKLKM